jgi:hypothetical protein
MIQNSILNGPGCSYPCNTNREIAIMHPTIELKSLLINPRLQQGGQAKEKSQQHYNSWSQQGHGLNANPRL